MMYITEMHVGKENRTEFRDSIGMNKKVALQIDQLPNKSILPFPALK